MTIKWAIVGSRDFPDPDFVRRYVQHLSLKHEDDQLIIISGGADGVDTWAVREAERLGMGWDEIRADWTDLSHDDAIIRTRADGTKYDALAGIRRNTVVVDVSDRVTAFWTGQVENSGTYDTIGKAFANDKLYDLFIRNNNFN